MRLKINVKGQEQLNKKLAQLQAKSDGKLKEVLTKSVIEVERKAKLKSPVDTGRLRASITHEVSKLRSQHIGRVGTNVEYAPYQEFGTVKIKAQPYLLPALRESMRFIKKLIEKAFKELK